MANFQDWSVGHAKESTYGTGVTPSRFLEFTNPKPFAIDRGVKQGAGIRVGSRVARSARRFMTTKQAQGDIEVELFSKGLGLALEACIGAGTSTLVSGTTYQQNIVFADTLPSHTIQFGVPNATGTIRALTFAGCVVSSWELGGAVGDIATLKTSWDARSWTTATAYATPSYVAGGNLYTVEDATIYSGTLTAPTTTALGSALTAVAGVKDFKVSVDNALVADRVFANGGGLKSLPLPGTRQPSVEMNIEYGADTLWDALEADSELTLVITLVTSGALSTGVETVQIIIPAVKPDDGLPEGGPDQIASMAMKFTGLDNLSAAQPLWVVVRTSDTAL
jgi:hypothetical protein